MKSSVWYVCLCAILMLVASPAVVATTYSEPDGGGGHYGRANGNYDSGGTSCYAWANADGSHPSSGAVYWASLDIWTDQAGWFKYSCSWGASATAYYTDYNGSGASGSGGGTGSTPLGSVSASASASYPGPTDDDDHPEGGTLESEWTYFGAMDGVSAESSCGAYASIGYSPNGAGGTGEADASVSF